MSVPDGLKYNTPYTMEEVSEAFKRMDDKEEIKTIPQEEKTGIEKLVETFEEENEEKKENESAFAEGYVEKNTTTTTS